MDPTGPRTPTRSPNNRASLGVSYSSTSDPKQSSSPAIQHDEKPKETKQPPSILSSSPIYEMATDPFSEPTNSYELMYPEFGDYAVTTKLFQERDKYEVKHLSFINGEIEDKIQDLETTVRQQSAHLKMDTQQRSMPPKADMHPIFAGQHPFFRQWKQKNPPKNQVSRFPEIFISAANFEVYDTISKIYQARVAPRVEIFLRCFPYHQWKNRSPSRK